MITVRRVGLLVTALYMKLYLEIKEQRWEKFEEEPRLKLCPCLRLDALRSPTYYESTLATTSFRHKAVAWATSHAEYKAGVPT